MADRERRPYHPEDERRTDPVKRGRCGRPWCRQPAAWVWTDAAGRTRHECSHHAGQYDPLEEGDERVRIGLHLENRGLTTQRIGAITQRGRARPGWQVQRDPDGNPTSMVWAYPTASRI